ncbi:MAG: Uma2 family endonuclease [Candidatus Tectomicrobia bacterium]|uniref:Uma2 family endonuclease n=1 Tax=Tectimicrobiota bacterium TaxID=2528274 RepID=A0A938B108_UNCTE|nr:Uma2 family endonuclease [Candidatus Tectomicrobia bacterium]
MFALVSPENISLPAGAVVRLPATWQEYQLLCQQRGKGSIPRIKYRRGEVLLMAPLPRHGRDASLLADIIKALLDHRNREYDAFTPVTMTLPAASGVEPDYCFYIDHWQAVSGKERIDWGLDPPPDLVVEIDVTSYTDVQDYLPYRVPEVWLVRNQALVIYQLQGTSYTAQAASRYFPDLDLPAIVARCMHVAYARNTSAAIRELQRTMGLG